MTGVRHAETQSQEGEEQGIFAVRDDSPFVLEPWTDPAFEEIEARIYYYEAKG